MKDKACAECVYYDAKYEAISGTVSICRRFPPIPVSDDARDKLIFAWPEVNEDDYCGEYKRNTDDKDGAPL